MTKTAPKPAPPKPWLSGHCNPANPPESHALCHGHRDDGTPCKCSHHTAERLQAHAHGIRVSADAVLTVDLDGITIDQAARVAHELRMAKAAIAAAEEFIAKHVADQWTGKWTDMVTVDGVGRVQPYRTRNTTWDTDDTVADVITAHMEAAGGEVPDPSQVARWILAAAHVDYFRAGKLKELDLDPDQYRHTTFGVPRLRVTSDDMVGDTTRSDS